MNSTPTVNDAIIAADDASEHAGQAQNMDNDESALAVKPVVETPTSCADSGPVMEGCVHEGAPRRRTLRLKRPNGWNGGALGETARCTKAPGRIG